METEIVFPAIGLWQGKAVRQAPPVEQFCGFIELTDLKVASQRAIRRGDYLGMTIVDSTSRTWVVRSLSSVGVRTPLWKRVLVSIFNQSDEIQHDVEIELEDRGVTPWSAVLDRVCTAIDQNPDDWMDDEVLAGESGPPIMLEDVLEALKAAVRRTTSIEELFDSLDLEQIYPQLQAAAKA
jgi:hypothetical protein